MSGSWAVRVQDLGWVGGRQIYLSRQTGDAFSRKTEYVTGLTLDTADPASAEPVKPFLSETREDQQDNYGDVTGFLQAMMDAGWKLGIRPSGHKDAQNETKALRGHLEDMRALVFNKDRPA